MYRFFWDSVYFVAWITVIETPWTFSSWHLFIIYIVSVGMHSDWRKFLLGRIIKNPHFTLLFGWRNFLQT